MTAHRCPVCATATVPTHALTILSSLERTLHWCPDCGHSFFPEPDWLPEAYESSIASTDVGLVERSLRLANVTTAYLVRFPGDGPILDFAAGTGLMVRVLRDRGFDARYFDEYGPNHLAKGFEVSAQPPERYRLITAVEVAEHLVDPVAEFRRLASLSDAILFTTQLGPRDTPPPADWDYLSPGTGQHISFYSPASLAKLAELLGFHVVSRGDMHLLSKTKVSARTWRLITTNAVGHTLAAFRRSHSLSGSDHEQALADLQRF
ncbi:MAG: methyltransferase domain-containing protein [Acidimicrobiales bacterium]|nr:methyltransferase domain-containing protein [Acidimicrobiales bacterium]